MLKKNIKHTYHCGNLKKKDITLIIYDQNSKKLANLFFNELSKDNFEYLSFKMNKLKNHGEKVPLILEKLMLKSSLILCMTNFSLAHSEARIKSSNKGARFLSLPAYDEKFILEKSINVNFRKYLNETKKITKLLTKSKKIFITTKKGTNLTLDVSGRVGNCCPGFVKHPGDLGSPPDIESNISPNEYLSNGKIIIDGSVADPKIKLLKQDVTIDIKKGRINKIHSENKKINTILNKIFFEKNSKRRILAEFGIGINHKSKLTGNMLTDEGCRGTVHFGFGSNSTVGGKNKVNFHLDLIMKKPTVYCDNKKIIENGKIKKI